MIIGFLVAEASAPQEREVTVITMQPAVTLAGTLTLPPEEEPSAVVVMLTGSGAQTRDEEVAGHKIFKVLAQRLAEGGVATLRCDDRGVGDSTGRLSTATLADLAGDVEAMIAAVDSLLLGVPVGVLGHSEGALVGIMVAASLPAKCSFLVTLGGPAWSGDSIIMSQARAMAVAATGRWDGEAQQRSYMELLKGPMPDMGAFSAIYYDLANSLGEMAALPAVKEQLTAQVRAMCTPHYRSFLRYDPAQDIAAITIPWLALQGDKDVQVLPANLSTIQQLNPRATTILLEGHNHLFQEGSMGSLQEYPQLGDPSQATTDAILRFLASP
ncbi:MAG: alpha/beta hydrolase [Bacteroidales bacterium]|nr:alpha/beta hydrolase [Bacteroidales bacterium]